MQLKLTDIAVIDRVRKAHEKLPELANSLQTYGQIQSITVRPPNQDEIDSGVTEGKPWILVTGGRRYGAAILAKWEEIRADNLETLSPFKRMAIELEENIQREDMHFADIVETKAKLHELYKKENPDHQIQDTASLIGESVASTSRDLQLAAAIRKNPGLRNAGSKKAATQAVKIETYRASKQLSMASTDFTRLDDCMETADMREWLHRQPTASIDLVGADLPYGIDYFEAPSSHNSGGGGLSKYDDSRDTTRDLIVDIVPELLRVTKPEGWLVLMMNWEHHFFLRDMFYDCCGTHYQYAKGEKRCKGWKVDSPCTFVRPDPIPWIWYRPNSRNNSMHPDLHAQNQYELILVINREKGKIVSTERVGNVLMYDSEYSERFHAMQKPVPLWEDIISRFTLAGELVADVCFGSGSTLAAAAKLGRRFAGCEQNPDLLGPAIGFVSQYYQGELTQ